MYNKLDIQSTLFLFRCMCSHQTITVIKEMNIVITPQSFLPPFVIGPVPSRHPLICLMALRTGLCRLCFFLSERAGWRLRTLSISRTL